MKADKIPSFLSQLSDSNNQKILIEGVWGIGKTKNITDFIKESDSSNDTVYYVSLFGRKDIESIINDLYFQIIESLPYAKLEKLGKSISKKLETVNFSYYGFSLSIPLLASLESSLQKKLNTRGRSIVILDDLERKHEELDIREVLGLIDNLAKIDGIKVVLVGEIDKLNSEQETFNQYKEKSIDRSYKIDKFSDDALESILGNDVLRAVNFMVGDLSLMNLRTAEKINMFIDEVMSVVGDDGFTNKFTKSDLYKMCYAVVYYIVEDKEEKKFLSKSKDSTTSLSNATYNAGEKGTTLYLLRYIITTSLENEMSNTILPILLSWYKTGDYSKKVFLEAIQAINVYEEPIGFYSSEEQIRKSIITAKEIINNIDGSKSLGSIMVHIKFGYGWGKLVKEEFMDQYEIVEKIAPAITNSIEIDKSAYLNLISNYGAMSSSEDITKVIELINQKIKEEYFKKLLESVTNEHYNGEYNSLKYLHILREQISQRIPIEILKVIINSFEDKHYLLPNLKGQINENKWSWSRLIVYLIKDLQNECPEASIVNNLKVHLNSLKNGDTDKMHEHRVSILLDTLDNKGEML
ncbi:P-loop NTPase fold protein [Geomicrobium sediminis]|uniref:KAP NTPase domain-containing protein n=1 Tax=Geomicrobium sediminis TaxID=1347788 RepID=A0ABS2P861_9BACL|nr:P-loop NTPase fold protein [Geomicrobium sediminis]MBM7631018.1 hypothetical protein [Geomicrobium sediminis]